MIGAAKPKRKGKSFTRKWFAVALEPCGSDFVMRPRRGARVVTSDAKTFDEVVTHDSTARLWTEIGDGVLLFGAGVDEIARAEVVAVTPVGLSVIRVTHGHVASTTVQVLRLKREKSRGRRAA